MFAAPHTPDQATVEQRAEHATNLGCYPLREVATAARAKLVSMDQVVAQVTAVPVMRQHQHVEPLQEGHPRAATATGPIQRQHLVEACAGSIVRGGGRVCR